MKIDGRPAMCGSIVVGPGQIGEIDIPWGTYRLVFDPPEAGPGITLSTTDNTITLRAVDNALGVATTLEIPTVSGGRAILNLAIYTIGDGPSLCRVIHYTAG
jgi:hypothetical protein